MNANELTARLARDRIRYERMKPSAVCEGSVAQMFYCIQDMQRDILLLFRENDTLRAQLNIAKR